MKKFTLYNLIFLLLIPLHNGFAQQCDSWYNNYSGDITPNPMSVLMTQDYLTSISENASYIFPTTEDFLEPINTGSNMTFAINDVLGDYIGGQIGAFIEVNGQFLCIGL